MGHLLDVKDLVTTFRSDGKEFNAIEGVSLHVDRGEIVGIVAIANPDDPDVKDFSRNVVVRSDFNGCVVRGVPVNVTAVGCAFKKHADGFSFLRSEVITADFFGFGQHDVTAFFFCCPVYLTAEFFRSRSFPD